MFAKHVCTSMKDTGTKALVAGAIAGAVGVGLYQIYQHSCCCNRVEDATDTEEDMKLDLQSLASGCNSQHSLTSKNGNEEENVVEVPVDIKALATQPQNVILQISAVNSPYQNATTQCCTQGQGGTGCRRQSHLNDMRASSHRQSVLESRNVSFLQSPRVDDDAVVDDNELFETESIRRLDGAINEVNYMLQRLGSMLERTRVDFASRRTSVASRETRGSERYVNL